MIIIMLSTFDDHRTSRMSSIAGKIKTALALLYFPKKVPLKQNASSFDFNRELKIKMLYCLREVNTGKSLRGRL